MNGEELSQFIQNQVDRLKAEAGHLGISEVLQQGLAVFVRFHLVREDRSFVLRCTYHENSPHPIPAVGFVNPVTLVDEGAVNWPNDRSGALKRTNNPPFICIPGVYEYHYQYHTGAPVLRQHLDLVNVISDIIGLVSK